MNKGLKHSGYKNNKKMFALYKKEFIQFFSSPVGYIALAVFFLLNSLFLWIIEGNYNIPNSGFAELTPFFQLAPWILMFVISAISMRSFSEELKSGTIETLLTKPITKTKIILAKFLAVWLVSLIMLIPTFIYVISINQLSMEGQHPDTGIIFSGYMALFLLTGIFSAIGVFSSLLFNSQVNAFLIALVLMFLLFYGLEGIGNFNLLGPMDYYFQKMSLDYHYSNIIKGLIKLSDIIFMLSVGVIFIIISNNILNKKIN